MNEVVSDKFVINKDYAFSRAYQSLNVSARLKSRCEDFVVREEIDVEFSGDGEHCWLYIQKIACNTDWVAEQLAKYCGVKRMAVSYAGLKDRHAVTSQWFSVQMPGRPTPEWSEFEALSHGDSSGQALKVLKSVRHNRKLQRGALKRNRFEITLRDLTHTSDETIKLLQQRCQLIAQQGVPNYFGHQRFGRGFNNLDQAAKLFTQAKFRVPKHKRGIYLSAARSWLFNCILSERINRQVWNKRLAGDVYMLEGKSACFKDDADTQIEERLQTGEIHPTAIMWGDGEVMSREDALMLEMDVIDQYPIYKEGLKAMRLQSQRRACRVIPGELVGHFANDVFVLSFSLPAGCYATMVLAEIFSELVESV